MPHPQAAPDGQTAPAEAATPEDQRDLQSLSEELASLAMQMKEIHLEKMAPLQAAVQESAKKLADQIHTEFGPQQAKIAEMASEIAALAAKGESTTAAQEQLQTQVREMEIALQPAREKLRETAAAIRTSEQQMREVQVAMRKIEREMQSRAVLIQKRAGEAMRKQARKESHKEAKELRTEEKALRKETTESKDKP
jgi:chromosome segregation ATPase